jgi:DNA polymerase III subunit alpha, Gram-positive type
MSEDDGGSQMSLQIDEQTEINLTAKALVEKQTIPNTRLIRKVLAKLKSNVLEVQIVSPFLYVKGSEHGDNVKALCHFIDDLDGFSKWCHTEFADYASDVSICVDSEGLGYSKEECEQIWSALVTRYARQEAVAGNWLLQADVTFQLDESSVPGTIQACRVSVQVGNEAERDALVRKRTMECLQEWANRFFAVQFDLNLTIIENALDKADEIRRQIEEQNRKEMEEVAAREREASMRHQAEPAPSSREDRPYRRERKTDDGPVQPLTLGRQISSDSIIPIQEIVDEMRHVAIKGRVFHVESRTLPSGRTIFQFNITDETDSITAKLFSNNERQIEALESLKDGVCVQIQGSVQFDTYAKEIVFMIQDMQPGVWAVREDLAEEKRVELHVHSTMSALDGVTPLPAIFKQAAAWGHKAVAITDHGVVQSFPEAYELGEKLGIKVLLGVEAYVVDDGAPIVYQPCDMALDENQTYVVFDTETTGLNAREDTLIEIAAVKMKGSKIVDSFSSLIDPERILSQKITEITGIKMDMLHDQPKLIEVLPQFRDFANGSILVAHNAEFDVGFLSQCALRLRMEPWTQPVIDTLALARTLYPGEKNYKLKTLTQKFAVELVNHHRALADAEATGKVFAHMLKDCTERGLINLNQLNLATGEMDVSRVRPFHATIFVQNQVGLRNLYELVSLSHTKYLYRTPRIPRSELLRFRDGLLFGTACARGELIESFIRGKSIEEIEDICRFYDFLEIQPPSHYESLVREEIIPSLESIKEIHRQILQISESLDIPVVATGDVHFLNPNDGIYRQIFLQSQSHGDSEHQPPLYFRTTDEMLEEFSYLGEKAKTIVVENTGRIADRIEVVKPIPDELFTPVIDGAEEEIRELAYGKAKNWYGDNLPEMVQKRLEKELTSIIGNGFSVQYLIAQKLVTKSLSDGYLVGSRGSVGSSFVATMLDITEVNPLPPHYRCESCRYSEFVTDGSYGSGFDMPDKACPNCGQNLARDGQDIPFETFLGFNGDKVPDIDLNFSGEYQPRAHKYTEELFGRDHVFRAGTISAVAEKTAYGYVRKFADEQGLVLRNAEIDRLVQGCTGVKRTTGQHPGGQIVVPHYKSIYEFTPVQFPADDKQSGTLTTHFDYHSGLESCLLKLDILGHDDPTVIRMLQDLTEVDPKTIPLNDPAVLALFRGTESLNVKPEDIRSVTGTYAIPEFGTKFVRQMLEDTNPTTFSELVRISGLSHGTDVWLNNAQELIRNQTATLSEVICARDDIMVYLIYKGLEPSRAFKIMESIRKGRGVKPEDEEYMRQFDVPDWYIESGKRIKYMFPKAHAAAYVIMAVRIAWFKVHYPLAFYATYFSVRADDFDVAVMATGRDAIVKKIEEIEQKGNTALPKEKSLLTVLEVALEMVCRGFSFRTVSLYESHSTKFLLDEENGALIPPFAAIPGVGDSAANNLYQARNDGPFLSIEDLQNRSRVSKTVVEILDGLSCLEGLPEANQLSLF